ncbi:MAG: 50S ribosomal protein P1 [Nitrososphaerota archaeon]
MIYIYAALLLHGAGKSITEENIRNIVKAAGIEPEETQIKALVAALSGVNIDEVLKTASLTPIAAQPIATPQAAPEPKKEEKKKEEVEEKKEEEALAGLSALFG